MGLQSISLPYTCTLLEYGVTYTACLNGREWERREGEVVTALILHLQLVGQPCAALSSKYGVEFGEGKSLLAQ